MPRINLGGWDIEGSLTLIRKQRERVRIEEELLTKPGSMTRDSLPSEITLSSTFMPEWLQQMEMGLGLLQEMG